MEATFTAYRVGSLEKTVRYGERTALLEYVDSRRPAGTVGRLEGLFCLPSLAGVDRWLKLAGKRAERWSLGPEATTVWQLICTGDPLPVYQCLNWEETSRAWDALVREEIMGAGPLRLRSLRRRLERVCDYLWRTTADWQDFQTGRPLGYPWCADEVEMLIPPALIVAAEPVELAARAA